MRLLTSKEIDGALDRAMQTPTTLSWVNDELDQRITETTGMAASVCAMRMAADGCPVQVASNAASEMVLVLAFNLGLEVGREIQAAESFAQTMGGVLGDDQPDAGQPE